jgi:hypothetical protein
VRVRTRSVLLHGKERQQKDAFYNSPAGEVYNSRKKVAVAMGLMSADDTTCGLLTQPQCQLNPELNYNCRDQTAVDLGLV